MITLTQYLKQKYRRLKRRWDAFILLNVPAVLRIRQGHPIKVHITRQKDGSWLADTGVAYVSELGCHWYVRGYPGRRLEDQKLERQFNMIVGYIFTNRLNAWEGICYE